MDWKRLFNPDSHEVVGLDIGSSSVKLVQLCKSGERWSVTAAAMADIADGNRSSGDERIAALMAIRNCVKSSGIETKSAVCGVGGPEVAVRYFKFPAMPTDEIASAVLLEAEQVCPFNVSEGVVDYQLIPNGNNSVNGVLVAATARVVKAKSTLVKQAFLTNVLMDVNGLALLNCLGECEKLQPGGAIAVLNVGCSYTSLAIKGGNNMPFIRDMSYGHDEVAGKISGEKGSLTDHEPGTLSSGANSNKNAQRPGQSLEKAFDKLIVDVTETLRYYSAEQKLTPVEKIFVCGGFASADGFVQHLSEKLPAPAVLWNPFEQISCDPQCRSEDLLGEKGPAFAVAAGLAMRSI